MLEEHRCPVCSTELVVSVGPLTLIDERMELREVWGIQCTRCGHLGVQIPKPWLARLYPPDVGQITLARRERHRLRQNLRHRHHRRSPSQS